MVVPVVCTATSTIALSHTVSKLVARMDSVVLPVVAPAQAGRARVESTDGMGMGPRMAARMAGRSMVPAVGLAEPVALVRQQRHIAQCKAARLLRLLECFSWVLTPFKLCNTIFYCRSYKATHFCALICAIWSPNRFRQIAPDAQHHIVSLGRWVVEDSPRPSFWYLYLDTHSVQGGTRTLTALRPLGPQPSASANSAT